MITEKIMGETFFLISQSEYVAINLLFFMGGIILAGVATLFIFTTTDKNKKADELELLLTKEQMKKFHEYKRK